MLITPDSEVALYEDIPITAGYQLVFSSRLKQKAYFASKKKVSRADCTYIKKTGRLRVEYKTNVVQQCNYISFKNSSFENVTFYARITDYEYVNNVTTDIYYSIDWWQTYMFDANYHACTIKREHLTESDYKKADANPWRHDIPELLTDEGLPCEKVSEKLYTMSDYKDGFSGEMTELIPKQTDTDTVDPYEMYTVILMSHFDSSEWNTEDVQKFISEISYFGSGYLPPMIPTKPTTIEEMFGTVYNGFYDPIAIIGYHMRDIKGPDSALNYLTVYGDSSCVVGLYVLPRYMLSGLFIDANGDETYQPSSVTSYNISPKRNTKYDPKLDTFPFKYLRVMSPQDTKEYHIDMFKSMEKGDGTLTLNVWCTINGIPQITLYPQNYLYDSKLGTFEERINFSNFPQVSYSIDSYLAFLSTQYAAIDKQQTYAQKYANSLEYYSAYAEAVPAALTQAVTGIDDFSPKQYNYTPTRTAFGVQGDPDYVGIPIALGESLLDANLKSYMMKANLSANAVAQRQQLEQEANLSRRQKNSVFENTKRAYANDAYHAGSSGLYSMYSVGIVGFKLIIVELNDDILDKYDAYLKLYGYKSLRTGIPHICDYVKNGSHAPHFAKFDNETFTYVQTENMRVTGLQSDASNYIEALFNAGTTFLKGDLPDET